MQRMDGTAYFDGPVSYTRNMFMKCTTGGGERQETEEEETQQENSLQVKTFLNWQIVVGQNASANNSHFLLSGRTYVAQKVGLYSLQRFL
jgi:hypothetical protein